MKTTRESINKYLSRLKNGEDCIVEFIDYSRGYIKYIAYKYLIDKSFIEDVIYSTYDKILHNKQLIKAATFYKDKTYTELKRIKDNTPAEFETLLKHIN